MNNKYCLHDCNAIKIYVCWFAMIGQRRENQLAVGANELANRLFAAD